MAGTTTSPDPKIIDLLRERPDECFTSLEFFPPRTEVGVTNLYARMDRFRDSIKPLFTDITWGAGGSTAGLTMDIAYHMHDSGNVANMHLTCTNMEKDGDPIAAVHEALQNAYDHGIRNIVALRGDPPEGQSEWKAVEGGFTCALDLVQYIKKHFGDEFGISVAGYPEGHPNAISKVEGGYEMSEGERKRCAVFDGVTYVCKDEDYGKELEYLKKKVDAGGDIIITQMFFDADVFLTFVRDCRKMGITCPIIPGLMCINNYNGFQKMTKFCKTRVPTSLADKLDSLKDDAEGLKAFGIEFGVETCSKILKSGDVKVLHFYTLNLEKVVYGILEGLGMMKGDGKVNSGSDADAKTMVAVGSAWARTGDTVKTDFGKGTVLEVREDGLAFVELGEWRMAMGQTPKAYLRKASYEKIL